VLRGDELPDPAERILEQLAAFGVEPEPHRPALLAEARAVLRLGDADRSGSPPVAAARDADDATLGEAGQLVR
jgi:hypothetical protein